MRHLIVTRYSVPRLDPATAQRHAEEAWLDGRQALFRRFFVPSVGRLGVPVVLLCSRASAPRVRAEVADLPWAQVEVQDDWYGGWRGEPDQMMTRLDSDDALHGGWLARLEREPPGAEVYVTRGFLRLDAVSGRLYSYRRRELSPLAAFPGGANPFPCDHRDLGRHFRTREVAGPWLLQVAHGGNLCSRVPSPWRLDRRVPRSRLADFGLADAQVPAGGERGNE